MTSICHVFIQELVEQGIQLLGSHRLTDVIFQGVSHSVDSNGDTLVIISVEAKSYPIAKGGQHEH